MDKNNNKDIKIAKVEVSPEDKLKKLLNKIKKECITVMPNKPGFSKEQACEVRYGGPAYAEAGDKPILCGGCGKPLTFIFQFREKYDKDLKPSGALYSVYYCFDCLPIGRPEEEHNHWVVVVHDNPDPSKFVEVKENISKKINAVSCNLEKVFVLPDYESIEESNPEIAELCEEIDCEDPMSAYEDMGNEIGCCMEPQTTIGGYPLWIQGVGSQVCPECGKDAEFICQIDSEDAANLMFGDAGSLYLFQCPDHKKKFAVEMQCF